MEVSCQLIISPKAAIEYNNAAIWYENQSIGLGSRFIQSIEKKLTLIKNYPERYPKRNLHFRETLVQGFPYIIVYHFNKVKKKIVVSAIYHTSRNPNKKYRGNQ